MKWLEMSYWRYCDNGQEPEVWDECFEPSDEQYVRWICDSGGDD